MQVFLLVALSLLSITIVCADPEATVTAAADIEPGVIRLFQFVATPDNKTANGLALSGVKIAGVGNAQQGVITVDALHISIVNPTNVPALGDPKLAIYVGSFLGGAAWDQQAQIKGASAALQEVAAHFDHIFVYFDHDGVPGYQYVLGNEAWDCAKAATGKYDCYNDTYKILFKDLTWSPFAYESRSCPAGSKYESNCAVHTFTTSGSMLIGGVQTLVATFVFKLANQPVLVDNVEVSNDWGKIDCLINYPWTAKGVTETNARVGMLAYAAGKVGVFGIVEAKVNDEDSVIFAAAASLSAAFFSWAGVAEVNSATSTPVYVNIVSGDQLKAYQCTGCNIIVKAIFDAIKLFVIAPYEAFGWKLNAIWFSWPDDRPTSIFWDPAIGVKSNTSSASLLTPAIFLAILFYVINYSLMNH